MTQTQPLQILSQDDPPAARIVNAGGTGGICFVCEHASHAIPAALGDLGLAEGDRHSHAVWDIGAEALARALSNRFDAPLILGGISRLVYDCNRPPERADATPARTEVIDIPDNLDIPPAQRVARIREVYEAFHGALSAQLDAFDTPPALVTIHSFSPTWHGAARATEIGLLHDADPALAERMLAHAGGSPFDVALNMPYSAADGVTHMLARHGVPRGLANVMIEVRNDLLSTSDQIDAVTDTLATMLGAALSTGSGPA